MKKAEHGLKPLMLGQSLAFKTHAPEPRRNRSKKLILKARPGVFLSFLSFSGNQIPFVHYEPVFG